MTTALATLVAFPKTVPPMLVVDLFAPEELSQTSPRKRPYTEDDLDVTRLHGG